LTESEGFFQQASCAALSSHILLSCIICCMKPVLKKKTFQRRVLVSRPVAS